MGQKWWKSQTKNGYDFVIYLGEPLRECRRPWTVVQNSLSSKIFRALRPGWKSYFARVLWICFQFCTWPWQNIVQTSLKKIDEYTKLSWGLAILVYCVIFSCTHLLTDSITLKILRNSGFGVDKFVWCYQQSFNDPSALYLVQVGKRVTKIVSK